MRRARNARLVTLLQIKGYGDRSFLSCEGDRLIHPWKRRMAEPQAEAEATRQERNSFRFRPV